VTRSVNLKDKRLSKMRKIITLKCVFIIYNKRKMLLTSMEQTIAQSGNGVQTLNYTCPRGFDPGVVRYSSYRASQPYIELKCNAIKPEITLYQINGLQTR